MMKLCVDANIIIYLIEGQPALRARIADELRKNGADSPIVASQLLRLECRVKPLRDHNQVLLDRYDNALADFQMLPVSTGVIETATHLRVQYGLKTPDALHVATAIEAHCDCFLTADPKLASVKEIPVSIINPSS